MYFKCVLILTVNLQEKWYYSFSDGGTEPWRRKGTCQHSRSVGVGGRVCAWPCLTSKAVPFCYDRSPSPAEDVTAARGRVARLPHQACQCNSTQSTRTALKWRGGLSFLSLVSPFSFVCIYYLGITNKKYLIPESWGSPCHMRFALTTIINRPAVQHLP